MGILSGKVSVGGGGGVVGAVAKGDFKSAGGMISSGGKQAITKYADPLDITGLKQAGRDREMEKRISGEQAQMKAFMSERPAYSTIATGSGTLQTKYKLGDAEDAKAFTVDTGALDQRMGLAKNVGVDDVRYTGDINAGQNFGQAQQNINALQQRAFGTETSPWAQKLMDQQSLQQSGALDQLGYEGALAQNQQLNNLAMQGGLEGGSRERLARASSRDQMMARQGVFRQGQMDRLGIGINDEAQRMQLQTQMPGMNLQMDQYNTGLQQQNRDVQNQLAINNQGVNLSEQQFNANLGMQKANQWASVADSNAGRQTQTSQYNAGAQNQVNAINNSNLINNLQQQNAYNLEGWQTKGSVLGNQNAANAQARQGGNSGGFFQKTLGIGG